ncbi:MAG: hypothetical protein NTW25_01835 [Candidatus Kapabacteria bacterium]|jgi:hypothetical protein|nr:hypothetical protein [Candidatus Kapabacteria bacterium]
MKKISVIFAAIMLILFALPNNKVIANSNELIELTFEKNNDDLQAINTNLSPDNSITLEEAVSQKEVLSNNNHFDSKIPISKKEVKQSNTISASEWLIVVVWGISVLLSSLYIKKIKRFN